MFYWRLEIGDFNTLNLQSLISNFKAVYPHLV